MFQLAEKSKFLKRLSKTKTGKHETFWHSIWNQAKAHGKSKQDKVTIQVPIESDSRCDPRKTPEVTEVELTIADIESMAKKESNNKSASFISENSVTDSVT